MDLTIQHVEHLTLDGSASLPDGLSSLIAQSSYSTPSVDADSVEFTRSDWDGSAARSSAPDPSDDDTNLSDLRDMFLLYPTGDDDGNKSAYKLPFRSSPDGPVNLNAISAIISAVNGARGGVEGVSSDQLKTAYNTAVRLGVEGGLYDDRGDAPDFSAEDASDDVDGDDPDADANTTFRASVHGADPDDTDDLSGVVWAAGDHTLYLDGDPTPVHVPEESIQRTHQNVTQRIDAGEPPSIGLDHGDSLHTDTVPVAAELDILTIGQATGFALSEDEREIVLTEYELTKDDAVAAAEQGQFQGKEYSIVGDLRIHTDDDGQPVTVQSGGEERLVVTAENVRQVDVVADAAVDGAGPGNVPPLQTAATLAASAPDEPARTYTSALRFAAKRTADLANMESLNDLEDVDDPEAVLEGAAEVVEHKDERIDALETVVSAAGVDPDDVDADAVDDVAEQAERLTAHADAARSLADFHDVDLDAEDDDDGGGVQALVDEHTKDLRRDVAAKEASLPKYDTDQDSVDDRVADLAGTSPQELRALDGERATEILESEQARQEYSKAFAQGDGADGDLDGSSSGAGDDDVEAVAESAMTVDELMEFKQSDDDSAAEFMAEKYDEDPADYVGKDDPAGAFVAATAGTGGDN